MPPSVAGVDSSMPEGIGLPPLPTSTRRSPVGAGQLVLERLLDAGQTVAVRPTKPTTCPPTAPAG